MDAPLPVFPASNLDRPETLLAAVGSFWNEVYAGGDLVQSVLAARARLDAANFARFGTLLRAISRLTCPVYRTRAWYPLVLAEGRRNATPAAQAHYDGTYAYDDPAAGLTYDQTRPGALQQWALPPDLAEVPVLTNRLTDASLCWVQGVDYVAAAGVIGFATDPFASPLLVPQEVYSSAGAVVDRTVTLWVCGGRFEHADLATQFGAVLGQSLASSRAYRDWLNAVLDALVQGTTALSLRRALGALADVPVVKEPVETVEAVFRDGADLWIVTDRHAYAAHPDAAAQVAAGSVVAAGQFLTDTAGVTTFASGAVPAPEVLGSLAAGRGFLAGGYLQDLVFKNAELPTTVTTDPDGYTRLEFPVEGAPGDVARFWESVQAAGKAAGRTLAMLLDSRPAPVGQPTAAALPATVNPLAFLCRNLWRDNLILVQLKPGTFGPEALGLAHAALLRKIVPPRTAVVFVTQLVVADAPITLTGPGTATAPGYAETVASYTGGAVAETLDPTVLVVERVRGSYVRGRCV